MEIRGDIEKNFTIVGEERREGFEGRGDEENAGVQRAKESEYNIKENFA